MKTMQRYHWTAVAALAAALVTASSVHAASKAAIAVCNRSVHTTLARLQSDTDRQVANCLTALEACDRAADPSNCRLGVTDKAQAMDATIKAALKSVNAIAGACETVATGKKLTDKLAKLSGAAIASISTGCQRCDGGDRDAKACSPSVACPNGTCGSYGAFDAVQQGKAASAAVCEELVIDQPTSGVCTNRSTAGTLCSTNVQCNAPSRPDGVCLAGDGAYRLRCVVSSAQKATFDLTTLRQPKALTLFGFGTTGDVFGH
jgi:hypothetical protein